MTVIGFSNQAIVTEPANEVDIGILAACERFSADVEVRLQTRAASSRVTPTRKGAEWQLSTWKPSKVSASS